MSIHATSPEILAAIRRQRRISFITSSVIGLLAVVLVMLLLSLFLLAPLLQESPTIVTYESSLLEEPEVEVKKIETSMTREPAAPSVSMAKVITAQTMSPTAIQVPDVEISTPSVDFGSGDDFGEGWGSGSGEGPGGGGASFFSQKVSAQRIAYVIDYSQSMRGEREKLMRNELRKSVSELPPGLNYQMIFFAGPAWVAGDEVALSGKTATITHSGRKYEWTGKSAHDWAATGKTQKAEWIKAGQREIKASVKLIEETKLVYGTTWEPALEMAMSMDPPPQIIFFMTDGVTGGDTVSLAKSIAVRAKAKGITVNTVAMMEPKADAAMKELAKRSGGQFSMIDKTGKAHKGGLKD